MRQTPTAQEATQRLAMLDWRFLSAVAVLGMNDWWWKAASGSWLTGKLSDVAGLVVLPVIAVVATRARTARARALVFGLIALWFAAMKTMATVAASTEQLAEFVTRRPSSIVVDPTDLLGIIGLLVAWKIVRAPRPIRVQRRVVGRGAFLLASLLCMATSNPEPFAGTDIGLNDAGEVVTSPVQEWGNQARSVMVSGQGPATEACTEEVCVRLVGDVLEEASNGSTFVPIWAFDASGAPSVRELDAGHNPDHRGILDVVAAPDGTVHALLGGKGQVVRSVDGTWSPPFSTYRPISELVYVSLFFACAAVLLLVGSGSKLTRVGLVASGVGALGAMLSGLSTQPEDGFALPVGLMVSALCFLVALLVATATLLVRIGGFPDWRVRPVFGVLVLVGSGLIGLSIFLGSVPLVETSSPLVITLFFLVILGAALGALALRWRDERSAPTADMWIGLVTGLVLGAAAIAATVLPLMWWQRSVGAKFVVAYPVALALTAAVLGIAVWRRRTLGLALPVRVSD